MHANIRSMLLVCSQCGLEFERYWDKPGPSGRRFCSRSCSATFNNRVHPKRVRVPRIKVCAWCDEQYEPRARGVRAEQQQFCSIACRDDSRLQTAVRLPDNWRANGKVLDRSKGYVLVYFPTHPAATNRGYVYEHRVVAEEMVGRRLRSDEHVHHRNGKRWDNRPENLEVMNARDHARLGGQRPEDLVI